MKIVIFGTGKIYARYKENIKNLQIVSIADNDNKKHGMKIGGIEIVSPYEVKYDECHYVVIMTEYYREIKRQLLDMDVPESKIIAYTQIGELLNLRMLVDTDKGPIELRNWMEYSDNVRSQKRIMLISHNFSYSGVPVVMMNMAKVLKKMGYKVVVAGVTGGCFIRELKKEKIDCIFGIDIFYGGKQFLEVISRFHMVIVSTITLTGVIAEISKIKVPVLWWIHESEESFYKACRFMIINDRIHLFACANRVESMLRKYVERGKEIEKLYYCIPDNKKDIQFDDMSEKVTFAIIGSICHRKAQDILAQAISLLPAKYRDQFELVVIGNTIAVDEDYWKPVEKKFLQMKEVTITGELSQDEIRKQYEILDVLICPSRDDPMPVVVTEAMMYSKACIVSENVGQAEFIREQENGFVFPNENADELSERIIWVMENREKLPEIGQAARQIYEHNFTEEALQKRMAEIIGDLCS